jgi:cysteine sulfinate desulfinase/cysteine desulfurase-like protein
MKEMVCLDWNATKRLRPEAQAAIAPVAETADIAHGAGGLMHVDAAQIVENNF